MASESSSNVKFEIGHVLFIDIVGYSKLLINEQSEQIQKLREIVRGTEQFRIAEAEGKLLRLPTGDGGALVFRNSPETPVLCALEISKELKNHPELRVRMGIHSGPVNEVTDLNEQANIAGAGINMAQRVMDCGDAGHILLSKRIADDLEQYSQWRPHLHDLGECEVKHGVRVSLVNLYTGELGNPQTPERFKKAQQTKTASVKRALVGILAILLLISLAILAVIFTPAILRSREKGQTNHPALLNETSATAIPEKSVAVLPFENLSDEKVNAYFATGIQDEILTRLAKIGALKVISRSSTQHYESRPSNLREIAQQLGVANILEGSVQKAGETVHVNVQLIRAATENHLWAESYNRKLDDIFAVEGEVAENVAEALKARLTGAEQAAMAQKPTNDPAAYDAYLRGVTQFWENTDDSLKAAVNSLEAAVRLDPKFALAWAALSRTHSLLFFYYDKTPARRAAAKRALAQATRLQPQLAEAQVARAYFQYWVVLDYKGARELLEQLRVIWPGNAEIPQILGFVSTRLGEWEKSNIYFDQAIALNPRDLFLRTESAWLRLGARDFAGALRMVDEALQIWPGNAGLLGIKAEILQVRGQLDDAQSIVDRLPLSSKDRFAVAATWYQAMLRRDPIIALKLFGPLANQADLDATPPQMLILLANLEEVGGDRVASHTNFARARDRLQTQSKEQPENVSLLADLADALAGLGERDAALSTLDKARAIIGQDARIGPAVEEQRVRILTRFGENEGAIIALEHLLKIPYEGRPLTPALLRLDPMFDPLRSNPRFQKLCEE